MYILTQKKDVLMEFGRLEICKNLTSKKDEKYVISACGRGIANPISAGAYPDEESAYTELRNIINALNSGAAVYEMN